MREGRDVVLWHDQAGVLAGMARLAIGPGDHMLVDARFRGLPYLTHGAFQDEIACEIVVRDEGHDDVMTRCRSCHERRRTIISNDGKWLCRYCQHLGYRSTIISPSIRMAERLSEIDALLWQGRPHYMTKRKFSELVDEGKDLRYLLEGRRTVAPPHQRYVLSPSWIEQPAPLLGSNGKPYVGRRA